MRMFTYSLLMLSLSISGFAHADPPISTGGQVINIYGSSSNLSEVLSQMKSHSDQLGGIRQWKLYSGRELNKNELAKFCPTCTDVDPLPAPIPVNPCKKNISTTNSPAFSYGIKGTPNAMAGLVAAAGGDKTIQIQKKYVLQMADINSPSTLTTVKKLCKDCIEVDPLPAPIPVGGGPCN